MEFGVLPIIERVLKCHQKRASDDC